MEAKKTFWQRTFSWFGPKGEKVQKAEARVPEAESYALEKMAKDRKNQRFLNDNDEEAKIVVWLMIRSLRPADEVLVYSKDLSLPFYSAILRASQLLDSNLNFRIVLDDKEGIEVIRKLPEDAQSRIDCRLATTQDGSHILLTPVAFRAEAKDYHDELFVVCNFYEPYVAQTLKIRFERIWTNSVPCSVS